MKSLLEQIIEIGKDSINTLTKYFETCKIIYQNPVKRIGGAVIINRISFFWGKPIDSNSALLQIEALKSFNPFMEMYKLLLEHFTSSQTKQIKAKTDIIVKLIENSIEPPSSISNLIDHVTKTIDSLLRYTDNIATEAPKIVVVPDTNSLIACPDPVVYSKVCNTQNFEFIITPTVTKELDKLKITHRDEGFRKKITSVINRIKGYRNQGSLIDGIKYHNSITIKAIAKEPNFLNLPSWLDSSNDDDRLIASILTISIKNPNDKVILVTSDINLQNKAEFAKLNYRETP